jgi:hypothetical protein
LYKRQKNVVYKTVSAKNLAGWMDGWRGGWMAGKAGLSIAYSNEKKVVNGQLLTDNKVVLKVL